MSRADGLITRRLHVNGDRFWMASVFYFVAYSLSLLPWQLERITLLLLHLVLLGSFWRSGGSQLSSEPKKALISTSTVSIPKVLNGKFILRFIAAVFTRRNFYILLYFPIVVMVWKRTCLHSHKSWWQSNPHVPQSPYYTRVYLFRRREIDGHFSKIFFNGPLRHFDEWD